MTDDAPSTAQDEQALSAWLLPRINDGSSATATLREAFLAGRATLTRERDEATERLKDALEAVETERYWKNEANRLREAQARELESVQQTWRECEEQVDRLIDQKADLRRELEAARADIEYWKQSSREMHIAADTFMRERDQANARLAEAERRLGAAMETVEAADGMYAYAIDYVVGSPKLEREVKAYLKAKQALDALAQGAQ